MNAKSLLIIFTFYFLLSSCGIMYKASIHGLNSGYYKYGYGEDRIQDVYLDVKEDELDVYKYKDKQIDQRQYLMIDLNKTDSLITSPLVFRKQSLDIDITSIVLKYRPSVYGLPAQLTSDLNFAMYAGWRFDSYRITGRKDPLGKSRYRINNNGFDFGFFAGPGTTLISPFTTRNKRSDEYNGMIIQSGIAAFLETNMASFGIAGGFDYLLNADRNIWIYNNKPWVGFVVGIALN